MKKVTIVVPVYNSANLVHKPLKSILDQQDMPLSDYEVICINDGSTDNSYAVLQEYERKYENVCVISQENKGLGGARNTGIKHAKGEYILFVDADDYILSNVLENIYAEGKCKGVDILEFEAKGVEENGNEVYHMKTNSCPNPCSGEEYIGSVNFNASACNKLYRTDFLKKNNLNFLEQVYIEDIEFNSRAFILADHVCNTSLLIAHFVQTPGSITRTTSETKKKKMVRDMISVILSIKYVINKELDKESLAFGAMQMRISSLVTTLLLRWAKLSSSQTLQKEIMLQLREAELYPVPTRTGDKKKDLFRLVINKSWRLNLFARIVGN